MHPMARQLYVAHGTLHFYSWGKVILNPAIAKTTIKGVDKITIKIPVFV